MPSSLELTELLQYARRRVIQITKDPEWAEEAVASAFLKLSEQSEWPHHPKAWLATAMRNYVIDLSRRKYNVDKIDNALGNDESSQAEDANSENFITDLIRATNTSERFFSQEILRSIRDNLSEREFELVLAVAEGLSHKEIADLLGYASAATVTQTLARIRDKLSQQLKDWDMDVINRRLQ